MASSLFFDLNPYKTAEIIYDRVQLYERLPQKHEFTQLDGIVHIDREVGQSVAFRNVNPDEWWCRGHIPGNPILPGVLMLEAAAQLAAFQECYADPDFRGFVGYGGVDECKFRQTVKPPARLWLLCRRKELRSRRIVCAVQGVVDDALVFESLVTGLIVPL